MKILYRLYLTALSAVALMATACEKGVNDGEKQPEPVDLTGLTVDGGFPIIAWTGIDAKDTGSKFTAMKECGINTYLGWYDTLDEVLLALDNAEAAGVKLIIKSDDLFSDTENTVKQMMDHPALLCYHIKDEPEVSDFQSLKTIVENIRAVDEGHPCYINLYPNWAWGNVDGYLSKVTSFLSTVPVEFLSFDHYPIMEKDGKSQLRPEWYKNLEDIRRAARAKNMPFWAFALALSHRLDDVLYPIPTLAELRLQMFSNLVYGAQGFQYFTYWGIYQNGPTQVYEKAQTVNRELQAMAPVFLGGTVQDVWHTGKVPYGTKELKTMPKGIKSLTVSEKGAIVSQVVKDGITYVAIVNKDYKEAMTLEIAFSGKAMKFDKAGNKATAESGSQTVDPGDIVLYQIMD